MTAATMIFVEFFEFTFVISFVLSPSVPGSILRKVFETGALGLDLNGKVLHSKAFAAKYCFKTI